MDLLLLFQRLLMTIMFTHVTKEGEEEKGKCVCGERGGKRGEEKKKVSV